jgi:TadE-like protein
MLRDDRGSVLVESTIAVPFFFLLVLGAVDVTYMFADWTLANKAAYVGARKAVVSTPVATELIGNITGAYDPNIAGQHCFDTGVTCPAVQVTCTGSAANGSCAQQGYSFNDTPFTNVIFPAMKAVFPKLQRQNVQIRYETNNLGFMGQLNGLPMNVTVRIVNATHQFYFIGPILRFFGGAVNENPAIPQFASTLQSEDLTTN